MKNVINMCLFILLLYILSSFSQEIKLQASLSLHQSSSNNTDKNITVNQTSNNTTVNVTISEEERKKKVEEKVKELKKKLSQEKELQEEKAQEIKMQKVNHKIGAVVENLKKNFIEMKKNKYISEKLTQEFQTQDELKRIFHYLNAPKNNEYKYLFYNLVYSYKNVIEAFDDSLLEAYKNVIETREKQMNVLKEIELVENLKTNYQNKEGEVENKKEIEDSNDLDLQFYKVECLEIKDKNECIEVETCSWNQIMNICKLK